MRSVTDHNKNVTQNNIAPNYTERLWPNTWLYIILLLTIPSTMLLFMPLNTTLGIALAPIVYISAALIFTLASPKITVAEGHFSAGYANIPVAYLGEITELDSDELTLAIGIEADARAYLLVRGWIHKALKITNTDPTDPAPYWIITTRRPQALKTALEQARAAA